MRQISALVFVMLTAHVYGAPQLISFKDGKIGVNFAGYHASAGLGGLLGNGASGGLFAEAGTPFGQSAKAGLGGAVEGNGGSAGGLYAGATAGGNVKAEAGLSGGVHAGKTAGAGYANAQAGDRFASSGLGGETSGEGASGFTFSGTKSFGVSSGVVKQAEVAKPVYKEIDVKVDAVNEVNSPPIYKSEVAGNIDVKAEAPATVLVKEVYVEPPPPPAPVVVEKHIYRNKVKPHRHHFRKTAYIGGYLGGGADVPPPPPPATVIYKSAQPVIEKRIDVGVESGAHAGAAAYGEGGGAGAGQVAYTKQVTFQRNPNFFADIFNIPISTLRAVGNFLGNAASSTNISVQKSASVQADKDISSKHAPLSSASSSQAQISVETPNASKFIDDILAIPINTLGAVNKFLENNVPARKNVQVTGEDSEPTKVRLGPHARRRSSKRVVVVQESPDTPTADVTHPELQEHN